MRTPASWGRRRSSSARFAHTDFTVVPYELVRRLAERLVGLAPIASPAKAAFFNAGTEAVENAVKFARAYTRRPSFGFEGAFHGRTLLSLAAHLEDAPVQSGARAFSPEIYRAPFPNAYRGPSAETALEALERPFVTEVRAGGRRGDRHGAGAGRRRVRAGAAAFVEGCAASGPQRHRLRR